MKHRLPGVLTGLLMLLARPGFAGDPPPAETPVAVVEQQCAAQIDRARDQAAGRSPKAIQEAIEDFQKVFEIDSQNRTRYPALAMQEIGRLMHKLRRAAAPFAAKAESLSRSKDFCSARAPAIAAMTIDPYDMRLVDLYHAIEDACRATPGEPKLLELKTDPIVTPTPPMGDWESPNEPRKPASLAGE